MKPQAVQSVVFLVLTAVFTLLVVLLIWPYLGVLAFTIVLAVLSHPLYVFLKKYVKYKPVAGLLTELLVAVVVLIPLSIFVFFMFKEAQQLLSRITSAQGGLLGYIDQFLAWLGQFIPGLSITASDITGQGLSLLSGNIGPLFSGTLHAVVSVLIGLILFYYFVKDGPRFVESIERLSPIGKEHTRRIFDRLNVTIRSVIKGEIIVALIQGLVTGLGFWIFGVPNAILWGGIAALMALIPGIGTTIVVGGGALYLFFEGTTIGFIGLIIWGVVIVGMIDEVLRPYLIGRGASIHPMLVLLSVLGGLAMFGVAGFIIGPLIMSVFMVLFTMYPEVVGEK